MKLFSGTAHPHLSKEVSQLLQIPLSKAEILRFENSECKVTIQENVKDQTCVVIQPTSNPTDENIMELALMVDALKRSEAGKIVGIIPYFGYARQNAQHRAGECVSQHVIVKFLESVGLDEITVFDLHEVASQGIFSVPFKNLSACQEFAKTLKKDLPGLTPENTLLISPDQEGIERARDFGNCFFDNASFEIGTVNKQRDLNHIHQSKALDLYGDPKGKTVILVDDICTSGGTLIHAAEIALQRGATKAYCAVTHHDFGHNVAQKLQDSPIEIFYFSNTIPLKENEKFPKLKEVSIASILAQELQNHL